MSMASCKSCGATAYAPKWNRRAVLAKWGSPVVAGEVAKLVQAAQAFVLEPTSLQKKLHLEAQAWGPLADTPQPIRAQSVPLTDEWIRSRCKESWIFDTAKQWVRMTEAAHGITKEGGQHAD